MSFQKIGLNEALIKGLNKEGITTPTQVQAKTFQPILDGKHTAVQSETGSGKTLAYLLPIMEKLLPQKGGNKVLVLVPTHELAVQVVRQVKSLAKELDTSIAAVPIVGNVNIKRQIEALKEKPQIIVGTTGRILELIQKKKIAAHLIQTVVVDEADKMLDKNQIEETKAVLKKCMRDVQKLFFSASLSEQTLKLIGEIVENIEIIRTKETITIPENIHHIYILSEKREKLQTLRSVISAANPKKAMVFINRVYDIEEATSKLQHHKYACECIHGSDKKDKRKQVVESFRQGKLRILIGTDMAARGLHFDDVDLVVHYSISENPKDYLHRAGRCGRNGKAGMSISIVTKQELTMIKTCQKEFGIKMQECVLKNGMILPVAPTKKIVSKKATSQKQNIKQGVKTVQKASSGQNKNISKKHLTKR